MVGLAVLMGVATTGPNALFGRAPTDWPWRAIPSQSERMRRRCLFARTLPTHWMAPPGAQAVLGERGRAGAGAGDDREGATVGELAGRRTRELVGHTGRVGKHRKGGRPAPLPLI